MRQRRKQFTLQQKVFIIKSFYQCSDVQTVQKSIGDEFNLLVKNSVGTTISKLVATFESTGSVNQTYTYEVGEDNDESGTSKDRQTVPGDVVDGKGEHDLLSRSQVIIYDIVMMDEIPAEQEIIEAVEEEEQNEEHQDEFTEQEEEDVEIFVADEVAAPIKMEKEPVSPKEKKKKKTYCRYCKKEFCGRYLTAHYRKIHSDQATYICPVCQDPFQKWDEFKAHKATHSKSLHCDECNKSLPNMSTFNRHLKSHQGVRNNICSFCGKGFQEASTLKLHLRVHTGEKPHKCQQCDKSFTTKSSLIVHERTHSGVRPYKCNFCEKAFADSSTRNVHHRQHTGESPFICQLCGKACKQGQNLRSHMRHMHAAEYVD